jgi:hypothetical protein
MILGITGFIGSGKDTIADYLVNQHNFRRVSFAASLKDAVSAVFGWDRELLEGTTEESRIWREQVDEWWSQRLNIPKLSPRWILQQWGTEVCRNRFHNDIWVASVENKLRQTNENIVITDCRFKNEIEGIKRAGGSVIRVHRGPNPEWYDDAIAFNTGPKHMRWALSRHKLENLGIHASEYSSVGLNYDMHINNDGTVEDLHREIDKLVNL